MKVRVIARAALGCLGVLTAGSALGAGYNPITEGLSTPVVNNTFGTSANTDMSQATTGFTVHFDGGNQINRLYDPTTAQAPGTYDLGWKNVFPQETNTVTFQNAPPAVGSSLSGGGTFDGTSIWITQGVFKSGLAPAIGTNSPGTLWNNNSQTLGSDTWMWGNGDANYAIIPIRANTEVKQHWYLSQQVYVPSHDGTNGNLANVGAYLDRIGFGMPIGYAGHDTSLSLSLVRDTWHQIEARVDLVTDGGTNPGNGTTGEGWDDDSTIVDITYYVDGVQSGAVRHFAFGYNGNPDWIDGPGWDLRLGWGDGLARGWQGFVPEMYIDNVTYALILLPEPTSVGTLALAGMALLGRRRRRA